MRNFKKFLALVLAVMMTLSLMVTVNAAAGDPVTDLETVTDEFQEAVQVLNGLGIITGYENGEFRPLKNITRAETTALVYRLHSGDAKNIKNNLYSTADNIARFKDVNPNGGDQWSAGYIGYCANQEIIKGVSADRFNPNGNVTGYQVLAMVLRAIGYGQNGEYEGTGWQTRVATTATKLGLLKNVDDTNYAGTLSAAATRELVAEIVFQAALEPTVTYTPAFGYEEYGDKSLAKLNFDLDYTAYTTVDKWGRPGYYWFQDTKHDGKAVASGSGKNVVATITPKAEQTYTSTIRECDLAHDLEITKSATFDLYVNDNEPITNSYLVVATDTVTKVGGQGRLTEVYRDLKNDKMASALADRVVMIDTFLAQVTGVSAAVKDAAGHVIVPAKLTVAVYDKTDATGNAPSAGRIISKDDGTNWEYSKGDMILLNAYTDHDWSYSKSANDDVDEAAHGDSVAAHTNEEYAAFEYERVAVKDYAYLDEPSSNTTAKQVNDLEYVEVLGVAKSTVAKQSVVYWNQGKHDVGGTDYLDQLDLFLNVAGTTVNSDFSWYFDQYDNVIGIGEAVRSNYGVITSIYSSFSAADGSTDGKAVAKAHVKFADGTEADVIIDRFLVSNEGDLDEGHQAAGTQIDGANATADDRNVIELLPMYDYNVAGSEVLTMTGAPAAAGYTAPSNVELSGQLLVAPVAAINKAVETEMNGVDDPNNAGNAVSSSPYFGIIEQNLFKFISSGDGKMTAMEVAGKRDTTPSNENTGIFAWNYNVIDSTNATEWKKNAGFLTVDTTVIRVDNNTQIMLKEGDEINVYNGLSDLPGDVDIAKLTEVDWSDANGDGIADVLYTTATVKGKVSHSLFYYNGGAAKWNGVDKKGTMDGWLDGVATTLTFSNEKLFNLVKDSMSTSTTYPARIFAVEVTNNEVTNLFGTKSGGGANLERFASTTAVLLGNNNDDGLVKNSVPLSSINVAFGSGITKTNATYNITGNGGFVTGSDGGNDYTTSTKIVYGQVIGAAGTYANGTVTVGGTDYTLTGVSKVLGNDLSYLNLTGRISDVTIVYENNTLKTIDAIYVTTEPDNTVSGTGLTFGDGFIMAPKGLTDDNDGDATAGSLGAWLLRFNGGVFYSKDSVAKTSAATAATMMYFPFPAGNAGVYTLNIYKNGSLRFSESGTIAAGDEGPNYFSFDFAPANDSTGSWIGGGYGLSAGTYTYEILFNGTPVPGTGGSFSLITK